MKFTTAIFDLDGTITDSAPGILKSLCYMMEKHKIPVLPEEKLRLFIGPPLRESLPEVFGFGEEKVERMIETYQEYYGDKGIFECTVFAGMPEALQKLKDSGVRILMATAKPEKFARMVAEHFDLAKYFDFMGGACIDESRSNKHEVIEYVLESCGITDRTGIVMIGDRAHDMTGAQKSGLHTLGVTYGYGSAEELRGAGADMLAASPQEIPGLIL